MRQIVKPVSSQAEQHCQETVELYISCFINVTHSVSSKFPRSMRKLLIVEEFRYVCITERGGPEQTTCIFGLAKCRVVVSVHEAL